MVLRIRKYEITIVKLIILLFISGFSSLSAVAQDHSTINLKEIPQRKVRKYIAERSIDQMNDFSSIHASWKNEINVSDFHVMKNTFYVKTDLSDVWECYRHVNPLKIWNGRLVRFGLLISKHSNSVIYKNKNPFPEIDTGQVYFLNLRLIRGLFKVPVAFEIINLDQNKQVIEFSYIDNNKSLGKQTLMFFDNGDGRTRIVHTSYFKSDSSLRDGVFYPFFHKRFIKNFHGIMRKLIMKPKPGVIVLNGSDLNYLSC
jgi:hypothetical protein